MLLHNHRGENSKFNKTRTSRKIYERFITFALRQTVMRVTKSKEGNTGGVCRTHGGFKNAYKILMEKLMKEMT
jgi:hypothetical protein